MHTLYVKNFLSIKNATLEINPFIIVIGPQASGKSILAKLVYFFNDLLSEGFVESLREGKNFSAFEASEKKKFTLIFPKYVWGKAEFEISYQYEDISIKIQNKKKTKRLMFSFDYSPKLKELHETILREWKKKEEEQNGGKTDRNMPLFRKEERFRDILKRNLESSKVILYEAIFTPAGRSFFSIIKENVFSFFSSGTIEIDYFLKEFGQAFEIAKRFYHSQLKDRNSKLFKEIEYLTKEILCGKYIHAEDDDWIESDKIKVRLINSSSGQQESLPMLVVLSTFSVLRPFLADRILFVIEEPEAHLYPLAQKRIVELIGLLLNVNIERNSYFVTTHSPYVLTCLNNLILSDKIKGKRDISIPFDKVSAYALEKGELRSIKDFDNGIIDATFIDSISNEIEKEYDDILGKIHEGKN